MADIFYIEKKYADVMMSHALREAPNECCGILAGANNHIIKIYQTTNAAHSPNRYRVDSKEMFDIYKEMRANNWEILGIYHSHTQSAAYPSLADIKSAVLSGPIYLILSLQNPEQLIIKGFRIVKGNTTEMELSILDGL